MIEKQKHPGQEQGARLASWFPLPPTKEGLCSLHQRSYATDRTPGYGMSSAARRNRSASSVRTLAGNVMVTKLPLSTNYPRK